jgi:hypothetical protein
MPIKMTPDDFFEAFTIGNYNEFIDEQSSVMKAFNTAVAASHLADCFFNYHKVHNPSLIQNFQKIPDFINFINEKSNNYFKDIRSISNAYKHLYTGLREDYARHSSISSAGTIESIAFEDEEINELVEESIDGNNPEMTVIYTRKTGEQIQFLKAIECVIDFWKTMLYD